MKNKEILQYMWHSQDWYLEDGSMIYIYSTKYKDYGRVATIRRYDLKVLDSVTGINSLKSVFLEANNFLRDLERTKKAEKNYLLRTKKQNKASA